MNNNQNCFSQSWGDPVSSKYWFCTNQEQFYWLASRCYYQALSFSNLPLVSSILDPHLQSNNQKLVKFKNFYIFTYLLKFTYGFYWRVLKDHKDLPVEPKSIWCSCSCQTLTLCTNIRPQLHSTLIGYIMNVFSLMKKSISWIQ